MRKIWLILAACLLLSGCGGDKGAPQPEAAEEESAEVPAGLTMELEHQVYDPSLTSYTYLIENGTEQSVDFGEVYTLQRQTADGWEDLTMRENAGWEAIGYTLGPGDTMALTCGFSLFEETPEAGEYRLVKEVGGSTLYAEFSLGESPYTAETPYGYAPLEELPEEYGIQDLDSDAPQVDGDAGVIFTSGATLSAELIPAFLEKVAMDVPCQLRTVQAYGESRPMVIDVIYEDGTFLWKMRDAGEITQRCFSYIVTDGTDLYLSNGADWDAGERYGDKRVFLVPPMAGEEWVSDVESMEADRLAENTARYSLWSDDGAWNVRLTEEPTVFSVSWKKEGEGAWGKRFDLQDWDGIETAITGIQWQADGMLLLTCETADGGASKVLFDVETGSLQTLSSGTPRQETELQRNGGGYSSAVSLNQFKNKIDKKLSFLIC